MKASTKAINAVTKARILEVLKECDKLGEAVFLKKYGYRASLRYQLQHENKRYPSKAVLGVAAGVKASQFSGGPAHTGRVLLRLGFTMADTRNKTLSTAMTAMVALCSIAWPFPALAKPNLPIEPVACFASGSNNAGEVRGWAALGHDVGVAAPRVNAATEEELKALAGQDIAVFVDSGAFSEVSFDTGAPVVVKPISSREWDKRLALYHRLAEVLGPQLHVVAPDQVGNQNMTLMRLYKHRSKLQRIRDAGAHVLVPVQKGSMSQADFMQEAKALLRMDCVPALPCRKAATTPTELRDFARAYKPDRIHLLGLGIRGELAQRHLGALADVIPDAQVTVDSCVIRAHCNKGNPKTGEKPRRIAIARKVVMGIEQAVGRSLWTVSQRKEFELLLAFGLVGGEA
jgi:hypothetical protein